MRAVKLHSIHGTENERSEANARDLAQVLEQTGEAVIVKDLNAVVTYWNREAASLYGFSAKEAIGQPLRKLHAAELSKAEYERLLERVRAGHPLTRPGSRNSDFPRRFWNGLFVLELHRGAPHTCGQNRQVVRHSHDAA
jgi:PAS domain S-box-containing protein